MPELRFVWGGGIGIDFTLEDGTCLHAINRVEGGYREFNEYDMGYVFYEDCLSDSTGELLGFNVVC